MPAHIDITPDTLKLFKKLVRRKVALSKQDKYVFSKLDDELFRPIFSEVFNGDLELAKRVLYNMVSRADKNIPIAELSKIPTLNKAVVMVEDALESKSPLLVISDSDADGALAQAVGYEFERLTGALLDVEPAKYTADTHGFSIEQVLSWLQEKGVNANDEFVVLTADLGTNQIAEQTDFMSRFPNANLIITDHHLPMLDKMVVEDAERSVLVNPYTVSELSEKNSSVAAGGYMLQLLFKKVAEGASLKNKLASLPWAENLTPVEIENSHNLYLETTELMGEASNMLDGTMSDIRIKPLKQGDVERAINIGRYIRSGGLGQWLQPKQSQSIEDLKSSLSDESANEIKAIQERVFGQNFMAKTLIDVVPMVLEGLPAKEVEAEIVKLLARPEGYYDTTDYVSIIKGRFVQFTFEQELEAGVKNVWLKYAQSMFDQVNKIGSDISTLIREKNFLNVRVHEESVVTMAVSSSVNTVFSAKQLSKAYYGAEKQLNMTISYASPSAMSLRFKSKNPIQNILRDIAEDFPQADINLKGHPFVGEIEVRLKKGLKFDYNMEEELFAAIDKGAVNERNLQPAKRMVEVDFFNIDAVMKVNNAMKAVVFGGGDYQIQPIIKLDESMSLTNDYDLHGQDARKIVEEAPWKYTSVSLDFDNSHTIMLPNTAIKNMLDSNFENRIKLVQTSTKGLLGIDIVTQEQMKRDRVISIKTHKNKEQEKLIKYFKENFGEDAVKHVSREEMVSAIKFVANPEIPFERHEALVLDALNKTKKEAYVVLDIEANDGGNAPKCFNLGLVAYTKIKGSGIELSKDEYNKMLAGSEKITNFRETENGYVVNERIEGKLVTTVINEDDISLPIKVERLTNMSKSMVREIGDKAAVVEEKILALLSQYDGYISQAHNLLGYDIEGIRANFPELYSHMCENVFFDSKPIARDTRLVYPNIEVAGVGSGNSKVLFVTTPGADYTVVSKLMDMSEENKNFTFPSLKGDKTLIVRDTDVFLSDNLTQVVTKVKFNREQLLHNLIRSSGDIPTVDTKHSVAFMIKMASVRDMLDSSISANVNKVDFDGMGVMSPNSKMTDLWNLFQDNYDFSSSLTENLSKLSKSDEYKNANVMDVVQEMEPSQQPENLQMAKQFGLLSGFKKAPTKAQMKKVDEGQRSVTAYDIFKSNALTFLSENKPFVDKYSLAWAYRLVLDHEEPTAKNLESGHIEGIARDYGFDKEIVEGIYETTYQYKLDRGKIDSYTIEETHNNIDLDGDTYQEGVVYSHMLVEKLKNPYINEPVPEEALKLNFEGMMKATWVVQARALLRETFERVRVNSYSQRQLVSFDMASRGRDDFLKKENSAMLKLKSLPDGAYVKLSSMNVDEWMRLSSDDKLEIEGHVTNVIDAVMLDNGLGNIKDKDAQVIMGALVHSDSVKESMAYIKKNVGDIEMNNSEPAFKVASDAMIASLVEGAEYKLSMNKWMNHDELKLLVSMVDDASTLLSEKFGYKPPVENVEMIKDALDTARAQYDIFSHLREHGELDPLFVEEYKEYIAGPVKAQITRAKNEISNKSELVSNDFPKLSNSLFNKKENPLGELLGNREDGGAVQKLSSVRDFANNNRPEDFSLTMQQDGVKLSR